MSGKNTSSISAGKGKPGGKDNGKCAGVMPTSERMRCRNEMQKSSSSSSGQKSYGMGAPQPAHTRR